MNNYLKSIENIQYKSARSELLNMNKLFIAFKECGFKRNASGREWYLRFGTSNYELFPIPRNENKFNLYKNACFICKIGTPRKIKKAIDLLTETRGE